MLFRAVLAAALVATLLTRPANSQTPQKMHRLAILQLATAESQRKNEAAFEQGLKDLGHVEGKNITIERRYADGRGDRLPALAAELVRTKPDVIFAPTTPTAQAAKDASASIPIVIAMASDPVGSGFAASLARPGGNVTGTSNIQTEVDARRVQMLKEMFPKLTRAALIHAGDQLAQLQLAAARQGGRSMGVEIASIEAQRPNDYRSGIAAAKSRGVSAILVVSNAQNGLHRQLIIDLAAEHKLPAIYPNTEWIEYGGLMSYGAATIPLYYRAAPYVDKILKGAKPGDLPIEQPTRFELEINLKTARELGITIPRSILVRADRVIE
jgi:putative ABC transport system substrate-binding protein